MQVHLCSSKGMRPRSKTTPEAPSVLEQAQTQSLPEVSIVASSPSPPESKGKYDGIELQVLSCVRPLSIG